MNTLLFPKKELTCTCTTNSKSYLQNVQTEMDMTRHKHSGLTGTDLGKME